MSIPNFPKQKISRSQKDSTWCEQSVDAIIEATFNSSASASKYQDLYDAYNGVINPNEYKYVTDPYKLVNKNYKYPARLRNYNIIRPVIDLLLGEKSKRPLNYKVVVKNADSVTQKEDELHKTILGNLKQQFINTVNAQGVPTGEPTQEVPEPQKVAKEFEANYRDARAIMGQEALDYMMPNLEIPDQFMTGFMDWLITGTVITYKGIDHEEPFYEVVNPLDIRYPDVPNVRFIEDLPYCSRYTRMTVNDIVDKFYDELKPDQIDYLENPGSGFYSGTIDGFFLNRAGSNALPGELIDVYHCVWKSFKKEGILHYTNPMTGEEEEIRVSDIYKPDKEKG
jgi:hypothetical protein